MKRFSLAVEVFMAVFLAALVATVATGAFARTALVHMSDSAIQSAPGVVGVAERKILAEAERVLVQRFDANTSAMVIFAGLVAGVAALAAAASINRPVRELAGAVEDFARRRQGGRIAVRGPVEIASLASSFNLLADSLEEEDHLRRNLVADISHELRNPITVAMAQTEAMLDGVLPNDAAHLRTLYFDLKHIEALLDDLRELAIAESGRWHYDMAPLDLSELVDRNARRAEQRVNEGVEVRSVGADVPVVVYGDELRLEQVIRNLLGNAKSHTVAGSITLSLRTSPTLATVEVIDTGKGISSEDLPHIFERFYRADVARASDTGGAGLGLSIVRSVVRDHGGEVFARSEPGVGTIVGFTLPRYGGNLRVG